MKRYVYLCFVFLFATASCHKREDIDPRDRYLGTYYGNYNSFTVSSQVIMIAYKDTIKVTKSAKNEYGLTIAVRKYTLEASLQADNTFKMEPLERYVSITIDGKPTQKQIYTGEGSIAGDSITIKMKSSYIVAPEEFKDFVTITGGKK